ncbi:MAG: hypothetical protein ACOX7R_01865 [Acetivibrionales bacterium]|jgi:hypothetical protein
MKELKKEKMLDEIKRLQEEIRELCETEENKRRKAYWDETAISNDYWHGLPKDKEHVPFTVEMEREAYSRVIGYSLTDFYSDPYCYILNSLKIMVFKFKKFLDCTPIDKSITYYCGAGYEKSIFGGEQIYTDQDAWLARENLINERVDIDSLEYPDFYNSGSMPHTHNFYSQMKEIIDDDFTLVFPQWSRSPWGVAWHLRGIDNLLIDIVEDYDWVVKFLDYTTEARKHWTKERAKFLNTELSICNIYNDEVTSPILSPKLYEELVRPTEIELSNFFGGVNYWHSCGKTTPFQKLINEIPNLRMVHISPWSSISNAAAAYDPDSVAIEIALYAYEDVINPPEEGFIEKKLRYIKEVTKNHRSTVRADGIQIINDVKTDVNKITEWVECARRILI